MALIRELDGVNVKENFTWRLNDGDKLVSDKYQIVEMFNSYFIELPKSIFTELINITGDYISPEKRVHSQLEIPHITPEQVNDFLDQIPVNKATGPDGVGIRLLKLAAPVISESLSRIINSCIITGKFPTKWKEASVTPIYKDQIKHSVADIYADDTTLSYAHDYSSAPQSITVELQKDITNLADWSRVNHMVLNEEKTKTLLIAGKRLKKKMDTLDIDLMLNGKKLQQQKSRQEFVPLVAELVDRAHVEPLHLKNNACALAHRYSLNQAIEMSKPHLSTSFSQVPPETPLFKFIDVLRSKCNLNRLENYKMV
ncbi:Hypothetical predicted protein [Paramuricea clavata]|uniref:Uncharacterized protein n=1 Tax=Paramuricea clavata TaxID=317549 RepID=A0A7D9EDF5_PARCT|nr:Hypothetical predicted protein [Paramuricea clavata]